MVMPERLIEPAPHRLTVDDQCNMAEVGILRSEDRVELIERAIIDLAPTGASRRASRSMLLHCLRKNTKFRRSLWRGA
jgi:hypothetical protein